MYTNRKCLRSASMYHLNQKIVESQKRGWVLKGQIKQCYNGMFGCLMVREVKQSS